MNSSPETMIRPSRMAFATAMIFGDDTVPEYWTTYFGLEPTFYMRKGEPFVLPSGRQSTWPGKSNMWGYSTEDIIREDLLDPHLNYLISKLSLPRPDLKAFLTAHQLKFRFSCFWANFTGDRIPFVEPRIKEIIEESGGDLSIDEYPSPYVSFE